MFQSVQENQTNEDTFDFKVILDFSETEKPPKLSAKQRRQLRMEEERELAKQEKERELALKNEKIKVELAKYAYELNLIKLAK